MVSADQLFRRLPFVLIAGGATDSNVLGLRAAVKRLQTIAMSLQRAQKKAIAALRL